MGAKKNLADLFANLLKKRNNFTLSAPKKLAPVQASFPQKLLQVRFKRLWRFATNLRKNFIRLPKKN